MECPNCKIEMEYSKVYVEFMTAGGTDVEAHICPICGYAEANAK